MDYFAQIPNTHTLAGYTCRVIEEDDGGQRLFLLRLAKLDGTIENFIATADVMAEVRRENDRATMSEMFG